MSKYLVLTFAMMTLMACSQKDEISNDTTVEEMGSKTFTSSSEQMKTDIDVDVDLELLNRSGTSSKFSL